VNHFTDLKSKAVVLIYVIEKMSERVSTSDRWHEQTKHFTDSVHVQWHASKARDKVWALER
jgi:hypothetical protein